MLKLGPNESLSRVHTLRLERNQSEVIQIEVIEALEHTPPLFVARVTDRLGIPNTKFMVGDQSFEGAVNRLLEKTHGVPLDTLCPKVRSTADLTG